MAKFDTILHNERRLCAMTGLDYATFIALLPHFTTTIEHYLARYTLDGYVRDGDRAITYANSPLPSAADRLLFILTYLKQNPIQEVQGQLFGMSQSNVSKWVGLLHAVLNRTLTHQELLPARTADDLVVLLAAEPTKVAPTSPLFGLMARSDRSIAPPIPRTSRKTPVARRSATQSKTSS